MARAALLGALASAVLAAPGHARQVEGAGEWWAGIDTLPPGLRIESIDSLYPVEGATPAHIRTQLDARGPLVDGRRYHGYYQMRWRYYHRFRQEDSRRCRTGPITLLVREVTTLPRLENPAATPAPVRSDWSAYLSALRTHESGHSDVALNLVRDFHRRVERLVAASCEALRPALQRAVDDLNERLGAGHVSYDERTRHGATQGAVWPRRRWP